VHTSSVDLIVSRVTAAVCIVTLSVFAVLVPWLAPEDYDPFWLRAPILVGAAVLLFGSFVSPRVRRNARGIAVVLGFMAEAWVLILGALNEMQLFRVLSIYVVATLVPLVLRDIREVLGFTLATLVGLAVAHRFVESPLAGAVDVDAPARRDPGRHRGRQPVAGTAAGRGGDRSGPPRGPRLRADRGPAHGGGGEERRRAQHLAQQANRAKSVFLANMSHELRTPLNAIRGYVELVEEELDDRGQLDLLDDLGRVRASADHLLRIIDDVLDLSRVEAGKLELNIERLDLGELVEAATAEVRPALLEQGTTLEVDVQVASLEADATRLRQVLVNLLSNAAKFTAGGTVRVEVAHADGEVRLKVADTGPGIPEEALPTLFDKFTQVDDSPTRRRGGAGLGLAISRELVERMGGRIEVQTTLGEGCTFVVHLPARSSAPSPGREDRPLAPHQAVDGARGCREATD